MISDVAAAAVGDGYSQFNRDALVETIRHKVGSGSLAVTLTTLAVSPTRSSATSSLYVIHALLFSIRLLLVNYFVQN